MLHRKKTKTTSRLLAALLVLSLAASDGHWEAGKVLGQVRDGTADPTLLPLGTGQTYSGDNLQAATEAGSFYLDPTSGAKVWRATGPDDPCPDNTGGSWHDYGDITQISRDLGGGKHTILIHTCSTYRLVDFTRGQGFANWRDFASGASPNRDLDFTFSNRSETPHIAYVLHGSNVIRYDTRENRIANTGFFPFATGDGDWLQNDKDDKKIAMTTAGSGGCKVFDTDTGQVLSATWPGHDECHLENNGRYVNLNTGDGGDGLWDLETNTTYPFDPPTGHIFHNASPSRYFTAVDVESGGGKTPHYRMDPITRTGTKISDFCGYMSGFHHSGSWIQPGISEERQWIMISNYGGGINDGCLKNAVGYMRLSDGQVRFLAHTFQNSNDYFELPFGTMSVDGKVAMFNSNALGGRGDVYVVEVPLNGDLLPSLSPIPPSLASPSPTRSPSAASPSPCLSLVGDLTCDSEVNVADLAFLADVVALLQTLDQDVQRSNADLTTDGKVGLADLVALADKLVGRM